MQHLKEAWITESNQAPTKWGTTHQAKDTLKSNQSSVCFGVDTMRLTFVVHYSFRTMTLSWKAPCGATVVWNCSLNIYGNDDPQKLKICWLIACLHPSRKVHTWIEICASLNHRKKTKADGSRLIPRKHTETLVLLSVQKNISHTAVIIELCLLI